MPPVAPPAHSGGRPPRPTRAFLIAAVVALAPAAPAAAQPGSYTAIRSGPWTAPTTWFAPDSPWFGFTPGPDDQAYIPGLTVTAISLTFGQSGGGNVAVDGGGLLSVQSLTVGDTGSASLNVSGGAAVTATTVLAGRGDLAAGYITVQGAGSSFSAQTLTLADTGIGSLDVSGGASATADTVVVGQNLPPGNYINGYLSVQGAGSTFSAQHVTVGAAGNANFILRGGGAANVPTVVLARDAGSNGNLEVSGAGTSLTTQSLTVGEGGYGWLAVFDGGSVTWSTLYLAVSPGSSAWAGFAGGTLNLDTIDFTGGGSATLTLGNLGFGITPAPVTATATAPLVLGGVAGSSGHIVLSAGSTLTAPSLTVGGNGYGSLSVQEGATATIDTIVVGRDAPNQTNNPHGSVYVFDSGSSLSAQSLTVGAAGTGYLYVYNGGKVTADTVVVGQLAPVQGAFTSGTIFVADAGSSLSAQSLTLGAAGSGYLDVSGGGKVTADTVVLGQDAPPSDTFTVGSIFVTGTGSSLSAQSLTVGAGGNGFLYVAGGAAASWDTLYLAVSAGSTGEASFAGGTQPFHLDLDTVDLTGAGSAALQLGQDGYAPVVATAAAEVVLGGQGGSSGTINVAFGSTLTTRRFVIGGDGDGFMNVTDGGQVNTGAEAVIAHGGGTGTVVVHGAGSKWTIDGFGTSGLAVGRGVFGGVGTLQVLGGGQVQVKEGAVAINSPSLLLAQASAVRVSGPGSSLVLDGLFGDLKVGDTNGRGVLTVADGGYVKSGGGYIGGSSGTIGEVTVTGANSSWLILSQVGGGSGILEVGRYLATEGYLSVTDGGTVVVYGQTTVGLQGGVGTITISGGTLATGPVLSDLGALLVGPTGTLAAGPADSLPSTLLLGGGPSSVRGTLDLRGGYGTPGALRVRFQQWNGQAATGDPELALNGPVLLAFATTNPGSSGPAANGSSSATLGTGTGNSLLTVTEPGTLDLTGATFHLIGGPGLAANWDPTKYYSWQLIGTGPGVTVTGLGTATIDASQFGLATDGGAFALTADGNGVYATFTPVPEPAAALAVAAGALGLGVVVRRRRAATANA